MRAGFCILAIKLFVLFGLPIYGDLALATCPLTPIVQETPSAGVVPHPPTEDDYSATLEKDGYEVVRDLPPFHGNEQILFDELFHNLDLERGEASLFMNDKKLWFALDLLGADFRVKPLSIPPNFSTYLAQRLEYLRARFVSTADFALFPFIDVRVGEFDPRISRSFHHDGSAIGMVETLNRSEKVRGTFFKSSKSYVFEPLPGEAVLFLGTLQRPPIGPPSLHSPPPKDGERIFIRYSLMSKALGTMSVFDSAGNRVYPYGSPVGRF